MQCKRWVRLEFWQHFGTRGQVHSIIGATQHQGGTHSRWIEGVEWVRKVTTQNRDLKVRKVTMQNTEQSGVVGSLLCKVVGF